MEEAPHVLVEEIQDAKSMKNRKASGTDNINAEILKAVVKHCTQHLKKLVALEALKMLQKPKDPDC